MRISRRIQLAGLVVLAGAGAASSAAADDLTIPNATTNPVFTATAAGGPPSPGDVTVAAGGSITVDGVGEAAITVNSNNDVTNNGTLASSNTNTTGGIRIDGGGFSGTVTNEGTLRFDETFAPTDTDSDGDLDGAFAQGTGRYGIMLDAGTFTGNIVESGQITIEGNDSFGIVLNGRLEGDGTTTGNLDIESIMAITGDNAVAVAILGGPAGGVAGDVFVRANINALGQNANGLLVEAGIDGELRLNGVWNVTGFRSVSAPDDESKLDADDLLTGGAAVSIHSNVAGGITVEGMGQVDDDDDDGDGENDEADDNRSATINSFGSAPAIWIANQGASSLDIGAALAPGEFGLHNLGNVNAQGVYEGFAATAVRIESLTGSAVTIAEGFRNEGIVQARAREADTIAIHVGADASVPTIDNIGQIVVSGITDGADTIVGILVDSTATAVNTVSNSGRIVVGINGETADAVGIRDLSGTLNTINNSGIIATSIVASDDDLTDDIVPVITGERIAIDLSTSSANVTLTQSENADTEVEELISGNIRFGAGNDTIALNAGSIFGDISFGAGADVFNITNGAVYRGAIDDSDSNLDINVTDGSLQLTGGNAVISDATFGAASTLTLGLSGDNTDPPVLEALGVVTFNAGSRVLLDVPTGLVEDTQVILTAASLFGAGNVTGVIDGEGTPFIYNLEISVTDDLAVDGAANGLQAEYRIKTASELGMTENQGIALNPILEALRQVDSASGALVALDNANDFFDAYEDLMPSYASASAELATTAIQQQQGATSNRLAATRLQGLNEVSAWAQEIGYALTREPATANGQAFEGHGFGMALGIDGPTNNGDIFGLSVSFIASEAEEEGRPQGEISATLGQLNAYYGTAVGAFDLDLIGGVGAGKMQSRRFVQIGETFSADTEADWWAFEGHGAVRVSAPMSAGSFIVTPQAALTYAFMSEQGYTEEGGGAAVDYEVGEATTQRLWADAGVEFAYRLRTRGGGIIAPRVFAGYRANLIDDGAERDFRFVSGTEEFTLTDEGYGDGGALVGLGVDATNGYSTVALSYEGEFGDQIERHSLNVGVRFRF